MAHPGQTLRNPASGEQITFLTTAAESKGEAVVIDLRLPPAGRVPGPPHAHPHQEERFEVMEGTMRFRLGRRKVTAGPGDVVIVAPGVAHDFANAGDGHARVRVTVRPALEMERLFETAVRLAEDGRTVFGGIPRPLALASFLREFDDEVAVPVVPRWLQHALFEPLARLGRQRRGERTAAPPVSGRPADAPLRPPPTPRRRGPR